MTPFRPTREILLPILAQTLSRAGRSTVRVYFRNQDHLSIPVRPAILRSNWALEVPCGPEAVEQLRRVDRDRVCAQVVTRTRRACRIGWARLDGGHAVSLKKYSQAVHGPLDAPLSVTQEYNAYVVYWMDLQAVQELLGVRPAGIDAAQGRVCLQTLSHWLQARGFVAPSRPEGSTRGLVRSTHLEGWAA